MITRDELLNSLKYVVDNSSFVKIDQTALDNYVSNFQPTSYTHWTKAYPLTYVAQKTFEDEIDFLFLIGNQAFCYWGNPKWTIEYKGRQLDGWWAAIACFQRALENGQPILEGKYLADLTPEQTRKLFAGTPEIPLLKERREMLVRIGQTLVERYNGRFHNFFTHTDKYSLNLAQQIAQEFAGFDDIPLYKGQRVYFFKKAQLVVNDIYNNVLKHPSGITKIEDLTGCADYKIPAILRQLGILVYKDNLSERIDAKIELPEHSEEEIEIRAAQLIAVDQISQRLQPKHPGVTPAVVQDILWLSTQGKGSLQKPYHLTKTIYY